MTPAKQRQVRKQLIAVDPRLAPVFDAVPPWKVSENRNVPESLMRAIVSQQLSTKVANVIWSRFQAACGEQVAPWNVMKLSDETLRGCGLSRQKAGYLRNVAEFAIAHNLDTEHLSNLTDKDVIEFLTRIKGVGRWTVEMLLIFVLDRPDVFPVDDLGIQNAMRRLYRMRSKGRAFVRRMEFHARPWRPYRSTVVRCLWRWTDNEPTA